MCTYYIYVYIYRERYRYRCVHFITHTTFDCLCYLWTASQQVKCVRCAAATALKGAVESLNGKVSDLWVVMARASLNEAQRMVDDLVGHRPFAELHWQKPSYSWMLWKTKRFRWGWFDSFWTEGRAWCCWNHRILKIWSWSWQCLK